MAAAPLDQLLPFVLPRAAAAKQLMFSALLVLLDLGLHLYAQSSRPSLGLGSAAEAVGGTCPTSSEAAQGLKPGSACCLCCLRPTHSSRQKEQFCLFRQGLWEMKPHQKGLPWIPLENTRQVRWAASTGRSPEEWASHSLTQLCLEPVIPLG